MVLGREDVARNPTDVGPKLDEGLNQHGGLHGHVQRTGDARPGERLLIGVLASQGHQAGHLVLGKGDLLATKPSEFYVGDLEVGSGQRHGVLLVYVGLAGRSSGPCPKCVCQGGPGQRHHLGAARGLAVYELRFTPARGTVPRPAIR